MITAWTKHLKTEEEKTNFERTFHSSSTVLERLMEILNEEEQTLDSSEKSTNQYDNANWAYLQAHKNGYRQALGVVKKLINLDHRSKNEHLRQ